MQLWVCPTESNTASKVFKTIGKLFGFTSLKEAWWVLLYIMRVLCTELPFVTNPHGVQNTEVWEGHTFSILWLQKVSLLLLLSTKEHILEHQHYSVHHQHYFVCCLPVYCEPASWDLNQYPSGLWWADTPIYHHRGI